jgi:endonuclease/exonuclease/phosphatase family metal-dependent hydrolase
VRPVPAGALAAALLLGGCAAHPRVAPLPQPAARAAAIAVDPETGEHSTTLTVVTYNVAGLPWPIRKGPKRAMRRIEAAMRAEWGDNLPDLLLLQEAFVPSAGHLPRRIGYPNFVRGPTPADRSTLDVAPPPRRFVRERRRFKGERWGKWINSGLLAASHYGIVANVREPFRRRSCAGWDCLASKGLMLVTLDIPGVPEPVMILNTHLNSRGSSGVRPERSDYAHSRQVREMAALLARDWRGERPLIYAGDFNARGSEMRFDFQDRRLPGELAHRFCHAKPDRCDIQMSWDSDEPWRDTQDLQGFVGSARVRVEPIAIEAEFDAPVDERMLSDHDALRVTYRLSWRPNP